MLKRLHLRNFTVFEDADFEFGPGLNVIVGANGTGKSHVLKAGYAVFYNMLEQVWESIDGVTLAELSLRDYSNISDRKIRSVFRPVPFQSSELIRRDTQIPNAKIELSITGPEGPINGTLTLAPNISKGTEVNWPYVHEMSSHFTIPILIPPKEVLTMGWLPPLYGRFDIPIDETYPDILQLLFGPPLRQPEPAHIVAQLQQLIGGKVEEEGGHFYLTSTNQPRMEMNLVAEGFRKFATLYKLLVNGCLVSATTLFWDEPEANLNPALLKEMAAVLTELAKAGFQIILATHSLFLLKELHILARQEHKPVRYFGLSAQPGEATTVATADNLELLPNIVALDAELDQSDRFQRVLDQEDANGN